jgi:hypothetical protein
MAQYPMRSQWQVPFRAMRKMATAATTFTPSERPFVCRELDKFFSTYPIAAEASSSRPGVAAQPGQPKLSPPARRLLERGFVNPMKFAQIPRELGIDFA